ncbi:MAG: prefoldin subunit alpha [Promethearchaeia archaeon]
MQNQQNQQLTQFRLLREQREMFSDQLEMVNASLSSIKQTQKTVENLKKVEEGDDILIPIGGIAEMKAKASNPEKILLYVSQDVVIEKTPNEALKHIGELIDNHQDQIEYLKQKIQETESKLQSLSQQFQQAYAQAANVQKQRQQQAFSQQQDLQKE